MAFILSQHIKAFPTAYRGKLITRAGEENIKQVIDPEAMLLSEYNFVHSASALGYKSSYIVKDSSIDSASSVLKLVVNGYYFEITYPNDYFDDADLYVGILLKSVDLADGGSTEILDLVSASTDGTVSATRLLDVAKTTDANPDYEFRGLVVGTFADAKIDGYAVSHKLKITDAEGKLCQTSFLPELDHGTTARSIRIDDAGIAATLTVQSPVQIDNKLIITDDTTAAENAGSVVTSGGIYAADNLYLGSTTGVSTVQGTMSLINSATITGFDTTDNIYSGGALRVKGDIGVSGNVQTRTGLYTEGHIVTNKADDGVLSFTDAGVANIGGALRVTNGNMSVNGKVYSRELITVASTTADSTGNVTVGGGLTVASGATFNSLITASNGISATTAAISDGLTVSSGATITGGLAVSSGGATISGLLTANDGASISSGISAAGGATITGGLTVDTITTTSTSQINGVAISGSTANLVFTDTGDTPTAQMTASGINYLATASVTSSTISSSNLSTATITSASISSSTISGSSISSSTLSNANLSTATVTSSNISDTSCATFTGTNSSITGSTISSSNISSATLSNVSMSSVSLNYAYVDYATVRSVSGETVTTTIYGPDSGTITLPANSTLENEVALCQNNSSGALTVGWKNISGVADRGADCIVRTDGSGNLNAATIAVSSNLQVGTSSTPTVYNLYGNDSCTIKAGTLTITKALNTNEVHSDGHLVANLTTAPESLTTHSIIAGSTLTNDAGELKIYGSNNTTVFEATNTGTVTAQNLTVVESATINNTLSLTGNEVTPLQIYNNGGTTSTFKVNREGDVTAKSYNALSDKRKKENIIDYIPTSSVLELPIKQFNYIGNDRTTIGCIAQDLQQICPEIVHEDENGYLSIEENKLIYLLIDEVKKLKQEVNKLREEM